MTRFDVAAKVPVESFDTDPAMEFWPRVEAAIFSTAVSRADAEWMLGPRCHKRGCKLGHVDEIDQFVSLIARRIADVVQTEMGLPRNNRTRPRRRR